MSEASLKYLNEQWNIAAEQKDFLLCAKILRSQINILKCGDGLLTAHRENFAQKVEYLESSLGIMDVERAITVIGHIRHVRKALSLGSGSFGEAFQRGLGAKERARIRRRNRAPALSLQNRADLGAEFPDGAPSDVLQPRVLGNGNQGLA